MRYPGALGGLDARLGASLDLAHRGMSRTVVVRRDGDRDLRDIPPGASEGPWGLERPAPIRNNVGAPVQASHDGSHDSGVFTREIESQARKVTLPHRKPTPG
jgi:hypothetical protein